MLWESGEKYKKPVDCTISLWLYAENAKCKGLWLKLCTYEPIVHSHELPIGNQVTRGHY